MNILEKIIAHKKNEVAERQSLYPAKLLERSIFFETPTVSLTKYLSRPDRQGIIAEFKRRSPSKGVINASAKVEQTTIGYMQAGASALSVLTDEHFFGGKNEDLTTARKFNFCPILRKDFAVSEYQIIEARSIGADAILLIAAVLTPQEVRQLSAFARSLGLEVLLEIHDSSELGHLCETVDAVGVNNRNLADFSVEVQRSFELGAMIPDDFVKVSESGLSDPAAILELREAGFQGFLIGESFMKHSRPEEACKEFIATLASLEKLPITVA
ncbi:MAG: indole-3-glycerol phosphate synthase TrpC [Lewinellaceae bacterium]|nr:indole-3-glycerol phosphate synthase TrpC [Saprospiraceae bacterium]MCB9339403.1 indole-3-glycerol phosphate synthase TrpC [Lewinellaceae bacterium]